MSAWAEASMRVGERATAAAGMPAGSEPAAIYAPFVPGDQARKLLHGLVSGEEMDEALMSCWRVAGNAMAMLDACADYDGQRATLMVLVAHMYAHGITYAEQRA